jgi:hypothetical protein
LLGVFFHPEHGGIMFLEDVPGLTPDYILEDSTLPILLPYFSYPMFHLENINAAGKNTA